MVRSGISTHGLFYIRTARLVGAVDACPIIIAIPVASTDAGDRNTIEIDQIMIDTASDPPRGQGARHVFLPPRPVHGIGNQEEGISKRLERGRRILGNFVLLEPLIILDVVADL